MVQLKSPGLGSALSGAITKISGALQERERRRTSSDLFEAVFGAEPLPGEPETPAVLPGNAAGAAPRAAQPATPGQTPRQAQTQALLRFFTEDPERFASLGPEAFASTAQIIDLVNPRPPAPTAVSKGQVLLDDKGNVLFRNVDESELAGLQRERDKAKSEGRESDAAEFQARISKLTNVTEAETAPAIVKLQESRDLAAAEGRTSDAEEIQKQIDKLGAITGTTEFDVRSLRDIELQNLRNSEIAARTALDTSSRIKEQISGRPELLGVPGFVARTGAALLSQGEGLARALGVRDYRVGGSAEADGQDGKVVSLEELTNPLRYADLLTNLAIESAQVRSAVVNLAFSAAAASGQNGRSVTDRDIERFIREIGGDISSPEVFIGVLDEFDQRLARNFNTRREVLVRGLDPEQQSRIPELTAEPFSSRGGPRGDAAGRGAAGAARTPAASDPLQARIEEIIGKPMAEMSPGELEQASRMYDLMTEILAGREEEPGGRPTGSVTPGRVGTAGGQ